jgi:hypothetical protein
MWTKDQVAALLETNDAAVERALVTLYACQTNHEQDVRATKHDNFRGFMPMDARKFSSFAEQVLNLRNREPGKKLSAAQLGWLRNKPNPKSQFRGRIQKYAGQLADIANGRRTTGRAAPTGANSPMPPTMAPALADHQVNLEAELGLHA